MVKSLVTIIVFLCLSTAAQAQNFWNAAATTCTPAGATVGHYTTVAGKLSSVQHLGNETGTLVFNCAVSAFSTMKNSWQLRIIYRDSTGTGTSASVTARIYKLANGTYTPALLGSVSSDTNATMTNNTLDSMTFNEMFNFSMHVYFVQVSIKRAAASEIVQFHGVAIDDDT